MTTIDDEDADVFEITDFTNASEWERFTAQLEEIIHEWKLVTSYSLPPLEEYEVTNRTWKEDSDVLQFANFKFDITHHYLSQDVGDKETSPPLNSREDSVEPPSTPSKNISPCNKYIDNDSNSESYIPDIWQDLLSANNDFPSKAHCLVRWYGLRNFVVLAPPDNGESINSESRSNILLSSIAIALQNTGCQVPIFVQVHKRWRRLYTGTCENSGYRTSFEMVHLKEAPLQYSHLSGLLDVFKLKANSPVQALYPVTVSVRLTYVLQEWPHYTWPQAPPDMDALIGGEVGCTEFGEIPFGACEDPVEELHLSVTWPSLAEEMIVENGVYSDLDPLKAPYWSVRVRMAEEPQCLLGDYLQEFLILFRRHETMDQLLGSLLKQDEQSKDQNIQQALYRIAEPSSVLPSLGTVVTSATSKLQMKPEEAPIPVELLNEILLFLFPDALNDDSDSKNADTKSSKDSSKPENQHKAFRDNLHQFKSAPETSLTYRLAICMCIVNHSYGGLRAVAHLWQEFILEMRFRWENNIAIPDLEDSSPNLGSSILHQKLQMLNCCIKHRKERDELLAQTSDQEDADSISYNSNRLSSKSLTKIASMESSSDDEFFECDDLNDDSGQLRSSKSSNEINEQKNKLGISNSKSYPEISKKKAFPIEAEAIESGWDVEDCNVDDLIKNTPRVEDFECHNRLSIISVDGNFLNTFSYQPCGRVSIYKDLQLLNGEDDLYVPITQEIAPMTEDMLEEQAEILAKLGTSPEGASLRARMQSACLVSDMEAFKAANPNASLGDFVRWYSPRDWIEENAEENSKGHLSSRMQIPGNIWVEVWNSAKPTPVRRQKRLFDDTKEAEKVLHWLCAARPATVAEYLTPMLLHAAIVKLQSQDESSISAIKEMINDVIAKAGKVSRFSMMDVKRLEDIVRYISKIEVKITSAQSLNAKFSKTSEENDHEIKDLITNLLDQVEIPLNGGPKCKAGTIIHNLFLASQKSNYMISEDTDELDSVNKIDFPDPAGKEYIIRTTLRRPAPWSRPSPQRMYCVVLKDDFRLAGAFTQDTTFQ